MSTGNREFDRLHELEGNGVNGGMKVWNMHNEKEENYGKEIG